MSPFPSAIASAVALATLSAFFAAPSAVPPSGPVCAIQDPASIDLKVGTHSPEDLVNALAQLAGCNVLFNRSDLESRAGAITLQSPVKLTQNNVWTVVENLLYAQDLGIVPLNAQENIYQLINAQGSHRSRLTGHATNMSIQEVLANRDRKISVQCVVPLEHVKANAATNTLRPFFTASGSVSPLTIGNVGNDTSLLLSGLVTQVAAAIDMVRAADLAAKNAKVPDMPSVADLFRKRIDGIDERLKALESR